MSAATTEAAVPKEDKPSLAKVLASPKMLFILILGAASGFPNQITESALQAWLKDSGATNTTIGIMSYVAIPYMVKFLWAPLIDRFPLPFLDRRRGWILITQLAIAAATAALAFQNPVASLLPVAICAVLIVFFSATQDIAFDAYKIDVSKPHERGLAAAATNVGYRAAAWIAAAVILVTADFVGWQIAMLIVAITMAAFGIATWFAPSPHYTNSPPRSLRESVVEPLRALFASPDAYVFIALIMLFKVGDAFALKLFTPFMMDVGFSKTEISLVIKAVFTVAAIVGAILGGLVMVRLGLLRSMLIFGVMQAVTNLLYYALAMTGKSYPLMVAATALDNIAGSMGNVASVALIMALCDTRFSAFQYALISTFALFPRYALGGPAGWIADHGGWDTYYVVSFVIGIPGVLLVWLLRKKILLLDTPRA